MSETSDTANTNYRWARALLDGLVAGGMKHVIVSPGSRSTPLALAANRHPRLTVRVILDERTAAFFALGMAKASQKPVALIATSGTAVANWLPAVTEADLSRIPLVLLSADRPAELRQCGANQTIQQNDLFGPRTRFVHELPLPDSELFQVACDVGTKAVIASQWPLTGPVHLNIPFREPLTPDSFERVDVSSIAWSKPVLQPDLAHIKRIANKISGKPGLIICGPQLDAVFPADAVARFAQCVGAAILADPLSNLRQTLQGSGVAVNQYDAVLRNNAFVSENRPAWVLRLGAMPVSKVLGQYLDSLDDVCQILIEPGARWMDPIYQADELILADVEPSIDALAACVEASAPQWLADWQTMQRAVESVLMDGPPMEAQLVSELVQCLPRKTPVFCGNSLAVRQLDWFFTGRSEELAFYCNRGASGIDGNIATLLGVASVTDQPLVGILGDLTVQHDIASLTEAQGINAVIIVLDNGGGGIFDYLPQAKLEEHEALFITPRQFDLETLAKGFGVTYGRTSLDQLTDDVSRSLAASGPHILHLDIDRPLSQKQHKLFWEKVSVLSLGGGDL